MPKTGPVWTKKGLPIGEPFLGADAVSCSLAPGAALPNDAAADGDAAATLGIVAPPTPKRDAILAPPANLWFGKRRRKRHEKVDGKIVRCDNRIEMHSIFADTASKVPWYLRPYRRFPDKEFERSHLLIFRMIVLLSSSARYLLKTETDLAESGPQSYTKSTGTI